MNFSFISKKIETNKMMQLALIFWLTSLACTAVMGIPVAESDSAAEEHVLVTKDGMEMIFVPSGNFFMGSDDGEKDEWPVHVVYLDDYWIDKTEVTNAMYYACMQSGPCKAPLSDGFTAPKDHYKDPQKANFPVVYVTWDDAKTYCEWVGRRIPTEAEWEKAARGVDMQLYPWGNEDPTSELLNFDQNNPSVTFVGSYPLGASPYGALDMAGNVWEWVADWYSEYYYEDSPASNPTGPDFGDKRVMRGGAYFQPADEVRAAFRNKVNPTYNRSGDMGFRCAVSAATPVSVEPEPTLAQVFELQTSAVDGMEMILIPSGKFIMGSDGGEANESPEHEVYLDEYWIDKTEVTNAMYYACMQAGSCDTPFSDGLIAPKDHFKNPEKANFPIAYVTWQNAKTYCEWAGRRLPTEAEWEKAARGTNGQIYPWGNQSPKKDLLNSDKNYLNLMPVGSFPSGASPYGALDMAGNIWEWVTDWYNESYYADSPANNPAGPEEGTDRVMRGGAYFQSAYEVRTTFRYPIPPDYNRSGDLGFRCATDK